MTTNSTPTDPLCTCGHALKEHIQRNDGVVLGCFASGRAGADAVGQVAVGGYSCGCEHYRPAGQGAAAATPKDPRKKLLAAITEKAWRQQVLDLARLNGWRCYFTWNSIHSPAGFPDLVLLRSNRLLFVELKSEKGKTTPDQDAWLEDLASFGQVCGVLADNVQVLVWRPSDWREAVRTLARADD